MAKESKVEIVLAVLLAVALALVFGYNVLVSITSQAAAGWL